MSNLNSKKVIYVLGTKAQFIKSKHILLKLYEKNINRVILCQNPENHMILGSMNV